PPLAMEEHVAVSAHTGIARPLVARHADELARLIEPSSEFVQFFPERIGDLEVVALVADYVDEGLVAGVVEILFCSPHSDGLAALAVQIGPIAPQRRGGRHAKRVGPRKQLT